ncbi:GIY-YIG nuclease family protein [Viridibacillus sp. FSL R5-0477]|uniref:Excinuclease ABC subunit C n=1 Tax=Viridibacillus arenosi FSL R5-213 TaxID=1227360 RepID=W4F7H8_9BACL|nr:MULTISPECIES: GIY-YIG nuclease family protein [Viridibacillus]ETT88312.1 excinuclease ABC subunit C [Viridibacillus arenosi FSL R5-213]OMC78329.1 endonuclease [Viridibacillus sp. FSL H8-0123]OMC81960.1 endonuclease [Viridibacillus sp. FSL H7-0596]OMC87623.1 endonuclease [Viridibacillus arenosi]
MEKNNKHLMYVLECGDGTYYTGYTNDLEHRLGVHNQGKGAKYTRARLPVRCIYFEEYETKQEAMRAEYAFKQLTRKQKINHIRSEEL